MNAYSKALVGAALILGGLSGCASILSGHEQKVAVTTTPAGAECELSRNGVVIARIASTPSDVEVEKTKDDINVLCRKEGYLDTQATLTSGVDPTAYGNIFLGGYGLITWGLDSIAGADNHYPKSSAITLGVERAGRTS